MRYESPIELMLAAALDGALGRNPRVRIIPQYRAGGFRYDFAIMVAYRSGPVLFVECDGAAYHATAAQRRNDRKKDRHARAVTGRSCLRFTGSEIWRDAPGCARKVAAVIRSIPLFWGV